MLLSLEAPRGSDDRDGRCERAARVVPHGDYPLIAPPDIQEYILFPGDCTFEKVDADSTGRTHVLKFQSSDQRVFVRLPIETQRGPRTRS